MITVAEVQRYRVPLHISIGARVRAYRALAELLQTVPTMRTLGEARAILGPGSEASLPGNSLSTLREMMAAHPLEDLVRQWHLGDVATHSMCQDPKDLCRQWACLVTELIPMASCTTDLLILATMADDLDWKYGPLKEDLAPVLRERRAEFLRNHAVYCLGSLARGLVSSRIPFPAAMGRALNDVVLDELK